MDKETYLGDGVYASCDGYQIWLRTPREEGDHKIALELQVFDNLLDFAQNVGFMHLTIHHEVPTDSP